MSAEFYTSPRQFTPLVPSDAALAPLLEKATEVGSRSAGLTRAAGPLTLTSLRSILRSMNSYYSNTIEGQGTHPVFIDNALHQDFSSQPDIARRQRLALAHIEAEQAFEQWIAQGHMPLTSLAAKKAHELLFSPLSEADRTTTEGLVVRAGSLRQTNVMVGRHRPPDFRAIERFLEAFDATFAKHQDRAATRLVLAACAHQRLAWVHPFPDGNGRTARLQTHGALLGTTAGLWSVNRGFARTRDRYYTRLSAADDTRHGDLDGRGNLTQAGLVAWVDYFLDICLDQVEFMTRMLDLTNMRRNIEAWVTVKSQDEPHLRPEVILPLYHLFLTGELSRSEFAQMTGLGGRNARYSTSALLSLGVLTSPSKLGPLHFGFPLHALQFLLPGLYPEAAAPIPGAPAQSARTRAYTPS